MPKIAEIIAVEIIDSRANPTVETQVVLDNGISTRGSVPSGISTGQDEAFELRDGDQNRFKGMGVLKAINVVNTQISPRLKGMDVVNQLEIDRTLLVLDGTENKSKLGANSLLSVSIAACKAAAACYRLPVHQYIAALLGTGVKGKVTMPVPMFNLINGGKHGAGNLDFQEFMVVPSKVMPYSEALRAGCEIYLMLKDVLRHRNAIYSVGDEGGFAPNLFTNADALEVLVQAIKNAGYKVGEDIFLSLDVAASHFLNGNTYTVKDHTAPLSRTDMINYLKDLTTQYHLLSIEDPLHEKDWDGWIELTNTLGETTLIVGDDLLVTNSKYLEQAIRTRAANTILVKPNQVGTVSETLQVVHRAKQEKWEVIVSHRSGETNDDFIADFAVGAGVGYAKFGAPARGERVAKYNRLLEISRTSAAQV